MNCKYCNDNLMENSSYCGNCGSIVTKEDKNIFADTFANILKGIVNPNSFIRNSKIINLRRTGIILLLIILFIIAENFINPKLVGIIMGKTFTEKLMIFVVNIILSAIIIFGIISIKKVKKNFVQIINYEIHGYLFIATFNLLRAIFNNISLTLGTIVLIYGVLFYTIIMIQGMKSIWKFDTKISVLAYVLKVILLMLITNSIGGKLWSF